MKEDVKAEMSGDYIIVTYHNRVTTTGAEYHHTTQFMISLDGEITILEEYHTCGQWLMGNPAANRECTVCRGIFK